jgi:hypothetical protein
MRTTYASKDRNHDGLVSVFRELGCSVAELVDTGLPGWPDLAVGCIGVTHLVELKNPETAYGRAGMNANQSAFARDWRGEKVYLVDSVDGVCELVGHWRRNACP